MPVVVHFIGGKYDGEDITILECHSLEKLAEVCSDDPAIGTTYYLQHSTNGTPYYIDKKLIGNVRWEPDDPE